MMGRRIGLPFFYGWVLVAIGFLTMAVGVNARTAFSLLFPPILRDFGWDSGVTARVFSFGFLVSAVVTPFVGRLMDRRGPLLVIELGVVAMTAGLLLATLARAPWQLYLSLGALVGGGVNCLAYTGQSLYLTRWFVRRRGLALSIAFSGVGLGSVTLLPWLQTVIENSGGRAACWALGILVFVLLAPPNLLLRRRPEDIGLVPDGIQAASAGSDRSGNRRSPLGCGRLDLAARAGHHPLLVDRARLFLWPVRLVFGAGTPNQVPDRHWLLAKHRSLGFGRRKPCCSARPDCTRSSFRPDRTGVGMDDR
jgi:MFS family permease